MDSDWEETCNSMESDSEETFISCVTDLTFLASSTKSEISSHFIQLLSRFFKDGGGKIFDFDNQIRSYNPSVEIKSLTGPLLHLVGDWRMDSGWKDVVYRVMQIIFLVSSMDLDLESEFISLIRQIISLFNSKPDSESELVSLITQTMRLVISVDSSSEPTQESELLSLISQVVSLKPETELETLVRKIISRFRAMNWEPLHLISFCPQAELELEQGKFRLRIEDVEEKEWKNRECDVGLISFERSTTENLFFCRACNGKNHEEYEKVPVEIKHPLHPKHSLQLVLLKKFDGTRACYCCDEDIKKSFYYCWACDFAINFNCVKKPPRVLSIDHPKWHEHTLALFPSQASFPCNLCAITHSTCPFYICPPCDFVAHQKCFSLPRVIRISRHPHHRISFTPSFNQGDRSCCGVCRKKMDNDYGGYSCFKDGCSYTAHSRCATQSNVWDGIELEGVPEEIEEEVPEPFVRISHGIIQHFSHPQHHLELDENAGRDYDEKKMCQACITPIYFGNFYSCVECEFILHEACANLSRRIYHPIHQHRLSLVGGGYDGAKEWDSLCSVCSLTCTGGFFYKCGEAGCTSFKLHVQCATTSEPFVHESHMHPLFLTSKPGEVRRCSVCKSYNETFNCIEDQCDFCLCFGCATIPQKLRYKHDKHVLTLCYGEETSTMTYWCEACEGKVDPKDQFYKCDEDCCVTLHIECLIGKDLYMNPGSLLFYGYDAEVCFLPNHHMSRPLCHNCEKHCPHTIVVQCAELIFCSIDCCRQIIFYM